MTSVTVTGPPRDSSKRKHLRAIDVNMNKMPLQKKKKKNMNKMPDVAMTLSLVGLFADGSSNDCYKRRYVGLSMVEKKLK